jgi:uncharacterized protein with GYD domain
MNRGIKFALTSLSLLLPGLAVLTGDALGQQATAPHHKYFFRAVYTAEGMKDLQKRSATVLAAGVAKFDASAGCKLETWYFDYTESANYGFVDCPDEIAMATISATANAAGFVRVTFRSVLSPEDMDKALAKSLATRPPQQQ